MPTQLGSYHRGTTSGSAPEHGTSEIRDARQSSCSVITSINNKLAAVTSSPKYTIFKVHELLRSENEMAYEPEILSIGPYHHGKGKGRLQVMEDWKVRLFQESLAQLEERDATKYVEAMKILEPKARECYSESTCNMNSDEFVEMLLLDGCFIIQFMRMVDYCDPTDPLFRQGWVFSSSVRDMLLFENQIPLFVVEELFSMIKLTQDPIHFHKLAFMFLKRYLAVRFKMADMVRLSYPDIDVPVPHILGLAHGILCSLPVNDNNDPSTKIKGNLQHSIIKNLCKVGNRFNKVISNQLRRFHKLDKNIHDDTQLDGIMNMESIPNAAKLHAAGVQFKRKKVKSNPFDISFKNGVMEIPTFCIDDNKESLYRNLIAYEQYNVKMDNHCVGRHVRFIDCLIDSAEDVALLRKDGIIYNILGDDVAASTFINKLCNHVTLGNSDSEVHAKIFKEVNAYHSKRRNKWMANLRLNYFNSPWTFISFLAAFLLLILTAIQAVFSILAVV